MQNPLLTRLNTKAWIVDLCCQSIIYLQSHLLHKWFYAQFVTIQKIILTAQEVAEFVLLGKYDILIPKIIIAESEVEILQLYRRTRPYDPVLLKNFDIVNC